MSIKDILNVIDANGNRPSSKVAITIAKKAEAHLTGLAVAVEPIVPGFIASPMPSEYMVDVQKKSLESVRAAVIEFQNEVKAAGVNSDTKSIEIVSGSTLGPFIKQCRVTDMIVIGQDNPDRPEPMRDMLIEAALFDTGLPILVVPHSFAGEFKTEKAVIAFDSTRHSARAVHSSLNFLKLVDSTAAVSVNHGRKRANKIGPDFLTYLQRHLPNATADVIDDSSKSPSETILQFAADQQADVIVMGGYGHSRMREIVMGGATREIFSSMKCPVIFAH